jgi:nitrogen fixation protein NifX
MEGLNASFESARPFAIYDAIRDAWTFVQAAGFEDISDEIGRHRSEGDDCTGKG